MNKNVRDKKPWYFILFEKIKKKKKIIIVKKGEKKKTGKTIGSSVGNGGP